jgi:uncharacterized delta-60 repeat protein
MTVRIDRTGCGLGVVGALTIAAGLLSSAAAWAAGGDLDPSFGTGGLVVSTLSPAADVGHAVAVQPDGKIVLGGEAFDGPELMLARYTPGGDLDPTFGTNGVVRAGTAGETVTDIVLQPDGKIVAAVSSAYAIFLTRYHADGTLDDTFFQPIGNGRVFLSLVTGTEGQGGLLRREADGIIVAGGRSDLHPFALERVFASGWPDSAFGAFFGSCTPIGAGADAELWDVAELSGDRYVAVGSGTSAGDADFAVVRFGSFGCPDPTFGSNGLVLTPIVAGADERARSVVVQPDGKMVVLGDTGGSPSAFALVRYEPDGSLDPTFGDGGIALLAVGDTDVAHDLAGSSDGGFVIGGQADGLFTIVRVDATGHPDPSFGTGGVVQIVQAPFDPCCSELRALTFQPDGRIVAVGRSVVDLPGAGLDVALARLLEDRCGNGRLDDGEECDDGNADAGDCCAPRCELEPADSACTSDGFRCTSDVCDGAGRCTHAVDVSSACRPSTVAGGARIAIENDADDRRDRLAWTWRKGTAVGLAELGDPTTTTDYVLCGSTGSTLLFELVAPPGGTCEGDPCWTASASGFRRRSVSTRWRMTAGPSGTPRAVVKGRGAELGLPPLPLVGSLRVQLRADTGLCIDSAFPTAIRNDGRRYKARSGP